MRRRIRLSAPTWRALYALSWETGRTLDDLAEEAFADLLKKHHRPRSLREALRELARSRFSNNTNNMRRLR